MDKQNRMVLGLGSNYKKEKNMTAAVKWLRECFADLHFSEPVSTEPIDFCASDEPFLNCVAVGTTLHEMDFVKSRLKAIERMLGRTAEAKRMGHISIDIDLLQWNDTVLKPVDWTRDYIVCGLASLALLSEEA